MKNKHRRHFIKRTAGLVGSWALPAFMGADAAMGLPELDARPLTPESGEEYWESIAAQFKFQPGLRYFNNASLGSSPARTRKATQAYRDTLDSFPSKYMWGQWNSEKEQVRRSVAQLFSVSEEEIALIHNTTEGMNLIARSFDLQAGDEVMVGDHEHPSGTIPWQVWQQSKGIKIVRPQLPILPESTEELVEVYKNAITAKTRIISMCHMVNTNGMILPVKQIAEMAHQHGILVAVDGAQAAGMLKVNLDQLGCDFYAASSHKWLFSPKGVGIFYARKSRQHHLRPLVVARGHDDESIRRLENYNTRNLPELLGLGSSLEFYNDIGPEKISGRYRELKHYFRDALSDNPRYRIKTPQGDELSAAIQVVEVVGSEAQEIQQQLLEKFNIDCRAMTEFDLNALRFSLAIYITKKDIDYLISALDSTI